MNDLERILSNKVELVLLHDSFEVMDPNVLLKLVNEFAAGYEQSFERTRKEKLPDYFHFSGTKSTIEVDYVNEPVVADAFSSALQSNHVVENFTDAPRIVEEHQSYVHICIWNGVYEPVDPITGEQPPLPSEFGGADFDAAISLLRLISAVQINHSRPLAVYWVQSDRLMRVPEYLQLAIDFQDMSLLVHPWFSSGEGQDCSLKTIGASSLVGRELLFDPVPMPRAELYDRALHFVSITRGTGLLVPDGDVFGRSEDESIRVHHDQDPVSNEPIVRMVVEYCQQFGIGEPPIESDSEEAPEAFNLEDPAEKAMHEKIEAMRQQALENEASAHDEAVFSEELGPSVEWKGVQRKIDMSSLRSLANSASPADIDVETKQTSGGNIMSKVSGLFQRNHKA